MYFLPVILGLVLIAVPKLSNRTKFLILLIPTLLIVVFRFGIGADYFSYEYLYNTLDVSSLSSVLNSNVRIEVGYRFIQAFFKFFGADYTVFVACFSLVLLGLTFYWLWSSSKYPIWSATLYYAMFFFVWILSAQRQGLVLAIGLIVFFTEKIKLSLRNKLLIVFLLSFVHISALVYLLVIVFDIIKPQMNKKKFIIAFSIALLFSFIPLGYIASQFSFIPQRILDYFSTNLSIFDFSNIIRFIFFVFIVYHYDSITLDLYNKRLVDYSLFGFVFYFFIRFTGIGAARFTIFFFILTVIVLPIILETYRMNKVLYILGSFALAVYSITFTLKESNTVIYQSGYITDSKLIEFESIFNKDYSKFNNRFSRILYEKELCLYDFGLRNDIELNRKNVVFDINEKNIVARERFTGLFGVLNQYGNWSVEPTFKSEPTLYRDVLVEVKALTYSNEYIFHDLTEMNRSNQEMLNTINSEREKDLEFTYSKETSSNEITYQELPESVKEMIPVEGETQNIQAVTFDQPFRYTIYGFKYFDFQYYLYVDENSNLIIDKFATNYRHINRNGFLYIDRACGLQLYNSMGEIIWFS